MEDVGANDAANSVGVLLFNTIFHLATTIGPRTFMCFAR